MTVVLAQVPDASPTRGLREHREAVRRARRDGVPIPPADSDRDLAEFEEEVDEARRQGVAAMVVPIGGGPDSGVLLEDLLRVKEFSSRLRAKVFGFESAEAVGMLESMDRLALVPCLGSMRHVARDLGLLRAYRDAGVGGVRLSDGWRSAIGDGALESTDLGLTALGRAAVVSAAEHGLFLDFAGTGRTSFLEAIDLGPGPVIVGGANAAAVHEHRLNLTDEHLAGIARNGGVACLTTHPSLLGPDSQALSRHLDHVIERVGEEGVGLGLDAGPEGDPPGAPACAQLGLVRDCLLRLGLSEHAQSGILGANLARVLKGSWTGGEGW